MTEPEQDNAQSGGLPDYYLAELKEAFALFDDEETNMISTENLFRLMSVLAVPALEDEESDLLHKYDPDETGFIDFNSCVEIMAEKWATVEAYDELKEAFLQFDTKASGFIKERELRKIMATLGNPLNKKELTGFMAQATPNKDGFIIWDDYLDILNPDKLGI